MITITGWYVGRHESIPRAWVACAIMGDMVEGDRLAADRRGTFPSRRAAAAWVAAQQGA